MSILLFVIGPADAFECLTKQGNCSCRWVAGSSQTYHIVDDEFSPGQITDIVGGASAWDAGTSEINRGADWHFYRGYDVSSWSTSNSRWDVTAESSTWLSANYADEYSGGLALTHTRYVGCARQETDIIFSNSFDWCLTTPSLCDALSNSDDPEPSIAYTSTHEFGHAFGLDHEDDASTGMNTLDPSPDVGGHPFGVYRISEDEYEALRQEKGTSSTGKNLALSKWRFDVGFSKSDEVWDFGDWDDGDGNRTWAACPGECVTSDAPNPILLLTMSTSTLSGVDVAWSFSTDKDCFDGDDVIFDTESWSMSVNAPASASPNWCVPGTLSEGAYYVCAKIDYLNEHTTESSENDNVVISERQFIVPPDCP